MTPLPRTKMGRRIDWLIFVALALLAAGAMRAQTASGLGYIASNTKDGCNTTICVTSGACMSTLAYCFTMPQAPIEVIRQNVGTDQPGQQYFVANGIRVADGARLCGIDIPSYDKNIDLLQLACVDYGALRAAAPQYPWPPGKVTQVLLHIREGDAVRVTVDGVAKFADLSTDAWGRRVAMVVFDGVGHTEVSVRVYRAVDE